jgi:hypothetical protein
MRLVIRLLEQSMSERPATDNSDEPERQEEQTGQFLILTY